MFLCFGIPMLYMCVMDIMNVLRTGINILCTFHVFMYVMLHIDIDIKKSIVHIYIYIYIHTHIYIYTYIYIYIYKEI